MPLQWSRPLGVKILIGQALPPAFTTAIGSGVAHARSA